MSIGGGATKRSTEIFLDKWTKERCIMFIRLLDFSKLTTCESWFEKAVFEDEDSKSRSLLSVFYNYSVPGVY